MEKVFKFEIFKHQVAFFLAWINNFGTIAFNNTHHNAFFKKDKEGYLFQKFSELCNHNLTHSLDNFKGNFFVIIFQG